ncbi:probable protein phosphatase 2C 79 [Phalaenopsis equestris]|uniref:probable protein phosphatase 2C 79 n=1 Tax=Phalaenopsis equestris TaxID=78828 RepID=UPI0009E51871|nr:probable protein phosphatase 2C 79 [Phalaenopsis equestris]
MLPLLINYLCTCWRPSSKDKLNLSSEALSRADGALWYRDYGHHAYGEFSMAVVQANFMLEDQSQVESGSLSMLNSGPFGTLVGVYDGHGGPEVSRYICNNLFCHIKRFVSDQKSMSVDVLRKAIQATEDGFLSLVSSEWSLNPQLASVGSCCLLGVVCDKKIYIANLGDSRAILGRLVRATGEVLAMQLSPEHNASVESVRKELQLLHPEDSQIVVLKHNVWRVKGIIQISRSIGDAYLKKAEYNSEPLHERFRLQETFKTPILSAEPSISVQTLHSDDQFLIFASDGLWEQISNEDAVSIVQKNPRQGIARRLVLAALQEAANKREIRYSDIMKIGRGVRRHFHDDISVVVLYLDSNVVSEASSVSLKGGEISLPANSVSVCNAYGV